MDSTRLPGKVLFEIDGKTIIEIMVERMKHSKKLDRIIVATSTSKKDDLIENFCLKNNIECYRGSEDNLIARYKEITDLIGVDIIAKFGADCPLIDPIVIDEVISTYLDNNYDYVSNYGPPPRTYPEGMTLDVYSAKILSEAFNEAQRPSEKEHISPFFWNNPERYRLHRVDYKIDLSKIRLSLDYPEDYKLIQIIFKNLFMNNTNFFTFEDIIHFLDDNPDLVKINSHIESNMGLKRSFKEDESQGFK